MRQPHRSGIPVGSPIANVLVVIIGLLVIGVSAVLGFFAFLVLSAIVLVTAAIIGLRAWWLTHVSRSRGARHRAGRGGQGGESVIEGEYRVVTRDRDKA